jgi:hypothetical protein
LAEKNNTTVTEQVRRAISTEKWLADIRDDDKKKVLIGDNGKVQKVVFRP